MSDDRLRVRSRTEAQRDLAVRALNDTLAHLETMPIVTVWPAYKVVRMALDRIGELGAGGAP